MSQNTSNNEGRLSFRIGNEEVFEMKVLKKATGNGFAFEGVVYEYEFKDALGNTKKGQHTVKRATSAARLVQSLLQDATTEPRKSKQTKVGTGQPA